MSLDVQNAYITKGFNAPIQRVIFDDASIMVNMATKSWFSISLCVALVHPERFCWYRIVDNIWKLLPIMCTKY